jgi:hypothetical protein
LRHPALQVDGDELSVPGGRIDVRPQVLVVT